MCLLCKELNGQETERSEILEEGIRNAGVQGTVSEGHLDFGAAFEARLFAIQALETGKSSENIKRRHQR